MCLLLFREDVEALLMSSLINLFNTRFELVGGMAEEMIVDLGSIS